MVFYILLLLIYVLKYGNQTRSASNIFKETRCIYLGTNIGTLIFISFAVFILFTTNYNAQIAVRGFGTLIVMIVVVYLLFAWIGWSLFVSLFVLFFFLKKKRPKLRAVYYSAPEVNLDGLTEKERQLNSQYASTLRERSGKELMLIMNTVLVDLKYRLDHKMMTVDISEQHLNNLKDLSHNLKQLLASKSEPPKRTDLKQLSSSSDILPDHDT
ncbi:hypothetical protein RFI_28554 [Reticulomyxa filosa]|uniref:Uncharacterized protein n=1 Tax=Reticulomyxa filosa TaxID=46433 RepID=X6M4B6_RETFI|nr:hypothetical protein RFI_28554 [Reticulomyxa filosa]|eukprot:ETO08833.1 hypothetical protein RFI_28554 [Reticulomyxa filosa]